MIRRHKLFIMADPKYASLPGIAVDQPDVFETSDLPEADQDQYEPDELDSESVEKIAVDPNTAYQRFKGKSLDAQGIDFSERLQKSKKTGYHVASTEYEMAGAREPETPQQKYQRLQHEMTELAQELNQIKDNVKQEGTLDKSSAVSLSQQVESLQHQLTDLHLDKVLGPEAVKDVSDPQGAIHRRLLTQLDSWQEKTSPTKSGKGSTQAPSGDKVTYELYYRPEQGKFSKSAKLADLEQRLDRLDAVIGQNPEKLSSLVAGTNSKNLVEAVASLGARTSLLDPSHLDQIEGRLQAVVQKLGEAAQKKTALQDSQKEKVSELYDLVKKWDGMASTLPQVVDRLTALQELHEQALQFSQALTHLDTAQQELSTHVNTHGDMLKELQKNFDSNISTIKSNCDSIQNRLDKLKK